MHFEKFEFLTFILPLSKSIYSLSPSPLEVEEMVVKINGIKSTFLQFPFDDFVTCNPCNFLFIFTLVIYLRHRVEKYMNTYKS